MILEPNKVTFSIKNLECDKVVVFQDRAEVRRLIKATLKQGENEITLNNISSSIDRDSVRVEGKGEATVLDVVCQSKLVQVNSTDTNEKLKNLNLEIEELESNLKQANLKLQRVLKQTQILNDFANTLSKPNQSEPKQDSGLITSKQNIDNFLSFIDVYNNKLELLDLQKFDIENEVKNLEEKLGVAKENKNKLSTVNNHEEKIDIKILLESKQENTEIILFISYVVYNASWSPKYDIRVFGKNKTMVINYFGLITQTTGEDWLDTKLSLSTAVPSLGGNVPVLTTQHVNYEIPLNRYRNNMKTKESSSILYASGMLGSFQDEFSGKKKEKSISYDSADIESIEISSTFTYTIPRKYTIPSDTDTHKVSISIINLNPEFEYETVPKLNAYVYLTAKVVNNSEYALLAGPANVFMDNNFVSKTNLKSISPQEKFNCSLGIDPAIRIDYKPIRKYQSKSGVLSKSKHITFHQLIEIKNTTQNLVKILLHENLPLSDNEKIQVKLLEPNLKQNSNVKLNKMNNLEFELNIANLTTQEISIKYSIEFPENKMIQLSNY